MNLWQRIELIEQVNYNYHYKYFKEEFTDSFWTWFCLAKVNICLFFGWQSSESPDEDSDFEWICELVCFDEEEQDNWTVPMGSWDWKKNCIPCSVNHWHFGIRNNSNY